jgi:hypothetical protein
MVMVFSFGHGRMWASEPDYPLVPVFGHQVRRLASFKSNKGADVAGCRFSI